MPIGAKEKWKEEKRKLPEDENKNFTSQAGKGNSKRRKRNDQKPASNVASGASKEAVPEPTPEVKHICNIYNQNGTRCELSFPSQLALKKHYQLGHSWFLRLPPEVRDKIYKLLRADRGFLVIGEEQAYADKVGQGQLDMMLVCKQTYQESRHLLYEKFVVVASGIKKALGTPPPVPLTRSRKATYDSRQRKLQYNDSLPVPGLDHRMSPLAKHFVLWINLSQLKDDVLLPKRSRGRVEWYKLDLKQAGRLSHNFESVAEFVRFIMGTGAVVESLTITGGWLPDPDSHTEPFDESQPHPAYMIVHVMRSLSALLQLRGVKELHIDVAIGRYFADAPNNPKYQKFLPRLKEAVESNTVPQVNFTQMISNLEDLLLSCYAPYDAQYSLLDQFRLNRRYMFRKCVEKDLALLHEVAAKAEPCRSTFAEVRLRVVEAVLTYTMQPLIEAREKVDCEVCDDGGLIKLVMLLGEFCRRDDPPATMELLHEYFPVRDHPTLDSIYTAWIGELDGIVKEGGKRGEKAQKSHKTRFAKLLAKIDTVLTDIQAKYAIVERDTKALNTV